MELKKCEYKPYTVREEQNVALIELDTEKMINCAGCGATLPSGQSFILKIINSDVGLGYCVCEKCHAMDPKEE